MHVGTRRSDVNHAAAGQLSVQLSHAGQHSLHLWILQDVGAENKGLESSAMELRKGETRLIDSLVRDTNCKLCIQFVNSIALQLAAAVNIRTRSAGVNNMIHVDCSRTQPPSDRSTLLHTAQSSLRLL